MSKAEFQLFYDGPALRDGTMNVNELASSLLAVGDLVKAANQQINEDRADVSVRVKSDFKRGSFEVALLVDQSFLEHAKNLLFTGTALGSAGILTLLFGTDIGKKGVSGVLDSVLDVWKKLKGEKPKSTIQDQSKGLTILVYGDGNQVNVESKAAALYSEDAIRSSINGIVSPLAKEGIKRLDVRRGKKALNSVDKSDLPVDLAVVGESQTIGAKVRRDSRETVLRVVRANFESGKWGFSDGAAKFSAIITDNVFQQKLDSGAEGFYKGDTLRVILTVTQTIDADGQPLNTKYEIERVLGHTHTARQQKLLPPSSYALSAGS